MNDIIFAHEHDFIIYCYGALLLFLSTLSLLIITLQNRSNEKDESLIVFFKSLAGFALFHGLNQCFIVLTWGMSSISIQIILHQILHLLSFICLLYFPYKLFSTMQYKKTIFYTIFSTVALFNFWEVSQGFDEKSINIVIISNLLFNIFLIYKSAISKRPFNKGFKSVLYFLGLFSIFIYFDIHHNYLHSNTIFNIFKIKSNIFSLITLLTLNIILIRYYQLSHQIIFGKINNRWIPFTITFFFLSFPLGYYLTYFLGKAGEDADSAQYRHEIQFIQKIFNEKVETSSQLVNTLSASPSFQTLPTIEHDSLPLINTTLDRYSKVIPNSIVYLLNLNGTVVATTNRDSKESFLGKNYDVRPYFQLAKKGKMGKYVAVGLTSGILGHYSSSPIFNRKKEVTAVVVIKVNIHDFPILNKNGHKLLLINKEGFVLNSNDKPNFHLQLLWPLAEQKRYEWESTKQFPLPTKPALFKSNFLGKDNIFWEEQVMKIFKAPLDQGDLQLIILGPLYKKNSARVNGMTINILIITLLLIFIYSHQNSHNINLTIKNSERRLTEIMAFLPDPIFAINHQGNVIFWNQAMENLSGILSKEILGKGQYAYSLPFYETARPLLLDLILKPELLEQQLYDSIIRRDQYLMSSVKVPNFKGKEGHFWVVAGPLHDAQGHIIGAIESIRDLTDLKKAEADIHSLEKQLEHSEKLASIGRLLSGITHEINNPLTIAIGIQQKIEEKLVDKEMMETSAKLNKALFRIHEIVQGLRSFSHIHTEKLEPVNVVKAIEEAVSLYAPIYQQEQIEIVTNFNCFYPIIMANYGKIQQIIINLLTNAKDAIQDIHSNFGRITIQTFNKDNRLFLTLSDNGIGMDKEQMKKIFDPFYTTKPVGKGTGLGLPIIVNILETFKGTIDVQGEKGQGTTFTLSFELSNEEEAIKPVSKGQSESNTLYHGKVLIVDDEEDILEILKTYLEKIGFTVETASDGVMGFQKAQQQYFDYIFSDWRMPNLSGEEFLRKLQTIDYPVSFFLTTGGNISEEESKRFFSMKHFSGHLFKPFSQKSIKEIISIHEERKHIEKKSTNS